MAYKIAFFGAKPYDIASFDKVNEKYNYDIRYYKGHLNPNNVVLNARYGRGLYLCQRHRRCRCDRCDGGQWCQTAGPSLCRF